MGGPGCGPAILLALAALTLYLCTPAPEEEDAESVLRRDEGPLLAVAVASLSMILLDLRSSRDFPRL